MKHNPFPDLTPPDLLAAGYTLAAHRDGWCWARASRYGAGVVYGAIYERVEDACLSARWDTVQVGQMTYWEVA